MPAVLLMSVLLWCMAAGSDGGWASITSVASEVCRVAFPVGSDAPSNAVGGTCASELVVDSVTVVVSSSVCEDYFSFVEMAPPGEASSLGVSWFAV